MIFIMGHWFQAYNFLKLLPENLKDLNCLELACGGAQNSIYLAKNKAKCTALDSSVAQISYAEKTGTRKCCQN